MIYSRISKYCPNWLNRHRSPYHGTRNRRGKDEKRVHFVSVSNDKLTTMSLCAFRFVRPTVGSNICSELYTGNKKLELSWHKSYLWTLVYLWIPVSRYVHIFWHFGFNFISHHKCNTSIICYLSVTSIYAKIEMSRRLLFPPLRTGWVTHKKGIFEYLYFLVTNLFGATKPINWQPFSQIIRLITRLKLIVNCYYDIFM